MSLIDWSDPDEMVGLLLEYVADELTAENDVERSSFLRDLLTDLEGVAGVELPVGHLAEAMQEVRNAQPGEFMADPVITHIDACVEELHRIDSHASPASAV